MNYSLFSLLDYSATLLLAAAAGLRATRYGHHFTGALALGGLVGLASPVLRDILLNYGHLPVLAEGEYAGAALLGAAAGRLLARLDNPPPMFLWMESAALGVASAVGAAKSAVMGLGVVGCILVALAAGTLGGVVRDVCLGDTPRALEADFYVTASAIAAMFLLGLRVAQLPLEVQVLLAAALGAALHIYGHWRRERLGDRETDRT